MDKYNNHTWSGIRSGYMEIQTSTVARKINKIYSNYNFNCKYTLHVLIND